MAKTTHSQDYEITKNILNIQRQLMESTNNNDTIAVTDDPKFGDKELSNEKKKLISALNSDVQFDETPILIYPNSNNVIMTGKVTDLNNLVFQFIFSDSTGGCYINVNNVVLNETNIKKINQLYNYFLNWKEEWLQKLPSFIKKSE